MIEVLDLFSAAAGGWSLGMHRAGFTTMAACEVEAWRRALYSENNPNVKVYDDVRTLTADRLLADLGRLPSVVVGSPPCQDISSANTKGRGVEGERSGLYFEAIRIIGEVRDLARQRGEGGARWFALENSANLRTRGADAVCAALEAIGYTCWPCVVRAGDIGANHERPRAWLIGCDLEQVGDAYDQCSPSGFCAATLEGSHAFGSRRFRPDAEHGRGGALHAEHSSRIGYEGGRSRGHGSDGNGAAYPVGTEVGLCTPDRGTTDRRGIEWSLADLADHLRLDDGLSPRLAGHRVDIGDGKGQSAASLIVEAFGDAVIPQIPEAIGRAILRTERALSEIYGRIAA